MDNVQYSMSNCYAMMGGRLFMPDAKKIMFKTDYRLQPNVAEEFVSVANFLLLFVFYIIVGINICINFAYLTLNSIFACKYIHLL